ncbi:receptor-like protein EIX2 [Camellia sinensis]|uniref:receptor-like protein EIX2 n=1 Tax=Camellia sinensis TaxID=4442 RepID=UPI0010365816|nr:receptor-like protein EIX2 [Camellia sinensis]
MGTTSSALVMLFALFFIERLEFICSSINSNVSCITSEREALMKFKGNLTDEANRLSSWVGEDCCTWKGVGCSSKTGHVVKLDLRNPIRKPSSTFSSDYSNFEMNKLGGQISPSLLDLNHLHYLDLSMNDMQISNSLGSLKSLRYLDLSWSIFNATIPHNLGNLSRLQYLNLSYNYLPGPIPDTLGRLTSLTVLDLSSNNFNDSMSYSLCNLSNLVHIDLSDTSHRGAIPHCLGNLASLSILRLNFNQLQGPIPSEMGNMTQLTELDLSLNAFAFEIPKSMRNLCNLRVLDLSNNMFTGKLSTSIGSPFGCIHNSLEDLSLSSNKLSGGLPNHLGEFKKLERLIIGWNSFYGPLPSSLGRLSYLRELDISDNQLNGSIPISLGQLSKLESLYLSNNSFVGTVFELHFAKLKSLNELYLDSNSLVLNVTSQWVPPFQLQVIELSSIKVGPQFPQWLETQKNVTELYMSNASISVVIPDWFESIYCGIINLDLSNNQIKGTVPIFKNCKYRDSADDKWLQLGSNRFEDPLTPLPSHVLFLDLFNNLLSRPITVSDDNATSIKYLFLSNNHLTGVIPASLCKAQRITVIDFSNNQLSGKIPPCLGQLDQLSVLDLTNNGLYGEIPSSLGSLQFLNSLHLRNNKFYGKLPLSLQNLTDLFTIDLGENVFTDNIPPWIGYNLTNLKFLNLQSNNFYGDIPPQLCHLQKLHLLNLAQNNIMGNIPRCFGNFTAMVALDHEGIRYMARPREEYIVDSMKGRELEYTKTAKFLISMDLSNNGIVGEIPEELMDLFGLLNLNLSGNHLKGRIPNNIGNLTQLESLDLSRNKLSGPIPPSLSSLTFLSHLNMSFNNLSGRIPTGNQLQTLNDPSIYIGNDGLCGAPLLNSCLDNKSSDGDHKHADESKVADETDFLWFYTGIGPGFLVGFLGVCGTLNFKRSWRYAYFQFIENNYNWISMNIAIKLAQLRRMFNKGKFGG